MVRWCDDKPPRETRRGARPSQEAKAVDLDALSIQGLKHDLLLFSLEQQS